MERLLIDSNNYEYSDRWYALYTAFAVFRHFPGIHSIRIYTIRYDDEISRHVEGVVFSVDSHINVYGATINDDEIDNCSLITTVDNLLIEPICKIEL